MSQVEDRLALSEALDALPHEQREVLLLKTYQNLTFQEIAGVLGISANTAASRHRYALAHLKESLHGRTRNRAAQTQAAPA